MAFRLANICLGLYSITKLYAMRFSNLKHCYDELRADIITAFNAPICRLHSIIIDISKCRLFDLMSSDATLSSVCRHFRNLDFDNRGIDVVNTTNMLHHQKVQTDEPEYFNDLSAPSISYIYTSPTAATLSNYSRIMQDLDIHEFRCNSSTCGCVFSMQSTTNPPGMSALVI